MTKCKSCGNEIKAKSMVVPIIGGQFGFELGMIVFGAYGIACFYSMKSVLAISLSLILGGVCFYFISKAIKRDAFCEACRGKKHHA